MRAVIQRVLFGSVDVNGTVVGEIGSGVVVLIGAGKNDTRDCAKYLADKTANLRIFEDDQGKMNKSLLDIGGQALVISQFTLYGDARKGRRPSFTDAASPEEAEELYHLYIKSLRESGVPVQTGIFGAHMIVTIKNDGPVTIWLDTDSMMNK